MYEQHRRQRCMEVQLRESGNHVVAGKKPEDDQAHRGLDGEDDMWRWHGGIPWSKQLVGSLRLDQSKEFIGVTKFFLCDR